jgi:hypothetical protein
MARIERATSPLPRGCSTTEPHGRRHRHDSGEHDQASDDNTSNSTPAHSMLERETGIEPASSAWKAGVLPLNYSRPGAPAASARLRSQDLKLTLKTHVLAWWRRLDSNQRRRKPTDLQSAPFSHSGTPPRRTGEYNTQRMHVPVRRAAPTPCLQTSRQSIGARPWAARYRLAALKCPLPKKGRGSRVADSGDG